MENEKNREHYLMDALTLAYLGDSVFSLMVKSYLVRKYNFKPYVLNKKANAVVCARTQAEIMKAVEPCLNNDEKDVVMRARNRHTHSKAKNSTQAEYCLATQLEALVGYLYLNGEKDKLNEMFEKFVIERL